MLLATQLVHYTLCNERFLSRYFCSQEVTAACKDNYYARIEALEAKSSIPKRVFEAAYNESILKDDSSLHRLFSEQDSQLDSEALVKRFEGLCTEYLQGTGQKYDKKLIHNTAEAAAEIYSDSFGLNNTSQFSSFITDEKKDYARNTSISLVLMIIPIILILVLYNKSYDILLRILSAFTATGITTMITSIVCLIAVSGSTPKISPEIYADAARNSVQGALLAALLTGTVIGIGTLIANITITDKIKNTPSDRY